MPCTADRCKLTSLPFNAVRQDPQCHFAGPSGSTAGGPLSDGLAKALDYGAWGGGEPEDRRRGVVQDLANGLGKRPCERLSNSSDPLAFGRSFLGLFLAWVCSFLGRLQRKGFCYTKACEGSDPRERAATPVRLYLPHAASLLQRALTGDTLRRVPPSTVCSARISEEARSFTWVWLKKPVPKWNSGKWKHRPKPA